MYIYVASSYKNILQPLVVATLRSAGHQVHNYRNPSIDGCGFNWQELEPDIGVPMEQWSPQNYRTALQHPKAGTAFSRNMEALRLCDACVLVLPCGQSASWEFGWALGAGKHGAVVIFDYAQPELMYLGNPILTTRAELLSWAKSPPSPPERVNNSNYIACYGPPESVIGLHTFQPPRSIEAS